jgi:hypothetical protein
MLIHLLADLHQPLHLGFASDKGGSTIDLSDPAGYTLHHTWDSFLLKQAISTDHFNSFSWFDMATDIIGDLQEAPERVSGFRVPLGRMDSGNKEAALEFARRIASETVQSHTCSAAYKHPAGVWIEKGDSLSSDYVTDRSRVVSEQLMKAGVRLAQLMDEVADAYFRSQRKVVVEPMEVEIPPIPIPFVVDVEEAVHDPANDISDDDISPEWTVSEFDDVESDEEMISVVSVVPSESPEPTTVATTSDPVIDLKKQRKNAKKKQRKALKKRLVDGVDLDSVILIKRSGRFYFTIEKRLEGPDWYPGHIQVARIRFPDYEEIFFFDASVFVKEINHGIIEKLFLELSGRGDEVTSSHVVESAVIKGGELPLEAHALMAQLNAMLGSGSGGADSSLDDMLDSMSLDPHVFGKCDLMSVADFIHAYPSKQLLRHWYKSADVHPDTVWLDILRGQADQIVIHDMANFLVVSTEQALRDRSPRWVFNKFQIANRNDIGDVVYPIYIDTRVIDYPPTKAMLEQLDRIGSSHSHRQRWSDVTKKRPRILDVLHKYKLMRRNPMLRNAVEIEFSKINTVTTDRPWETIEFVIRDKKDRDRLVAEYGSFL